jgi:hypothetical protein
MVRRKNRRIIPAQVIPVFFSGIILSPPLFYSQLSWKGPIIDINTGSVDIFRAIGCQPKHGFCNFFGFSKAARIDDFPDSFFFSTLGWLPAYLWQQGRVLLH